ncbi:MAG: hypothetical protein IT331_15820 [Anaerolineae bacterium]|nr:hypothetical protein [Anaerolineae bacterium]
MLSSDKRAGRRLPLEQLSLLVGMNVLGLTLSLLLVLPERLVQLGFLGTDASIVLSGPWLFAGLLSVMTAAGVESIMRAHPRVHLSETPYTAILWILPCIIVTGTALTLPLLRDSAQIAFLTIIGSGVLLTLVVLGEYLTVDLQDPAYAFARLGLNLAVYLAALGLFQAIYSFKLRSLQSGSLTLVVTALLALELLRASESDVRRTWIYAAVVGVGLAESIWAINYWNLDSFVGAVVLLLIFYSLTGLAQQYLFGKLNWRTILEFVIVAGLVGVLMVRRLG